jgi:DNA polymerase-3 subunit gamma/tau
MSSQLSLYRLYRPKTFKEVIGQEFIVNSLMNAIKTNRIVHAYIFAGSRGTGKTSIAKIFAKAINCITPINGDACEQCEHCKLININQAIDIIELDAASNNGIDDVRQIIETAQFLPSVLNKKVYIIDEAHMLTTAAWNALLKTIEEAPKHVIFIFATTELHKIPPTIASRCQQYLFNRLNNHELTKLTKDICQKQNIKIDEQSINKIINLADGSARDTLSIIDQISVYSNNDISVDKLNKVFGLLDTDKKIDFINDLINGNIKKLISQLDDYLVAGVNITQLTYDLINLLIDKLIYLQTSDLSILKILNSSNVNAFNLSITQLIEMINI